MVLQHELIYALVGYTGKVVIKREGRFDLAPGLPLVSSSERSLVKRLLELAECYSAIVHFCDTTLDGEADYCSSIRPSNSSFATAFALGLEECLEPYRARVLELEQQLFRTPDLSLPTMQLAFCDFEIEIPQLRRIVAAVEKDALRGVALLDFLEYTHNSCVNSVRGCVGVLLRHTRLVMLSQLSHWLLYGELSTHDDFFIRRGAHASTEDGSDSFDQPTPPGRPGAAVGRERELVEVEVASKVYAGWAAFEIAPELKPELLPMRLAERVLFIGKGAAVCPTLLRCLE